MSVRITLGIVGGLVAVGFLMLPAWSAEKLEPRAFKSMGEAIGWVKARGSCSKGAEDIRACHVDIELPAAIYGRPISPGFDVSGRMSAVESPEDSNLVVAIHRTREFAVSPTDPRVTIKSTLSTIRTFVAGGGKAIKDTRVMLQNYKGEVIMRANASGADVEFFPDDIRLLLNTFGIGWKWEPAESGAGY
jgi:hypothetical protein